MNIGLDFGTTFSTACVAVSEDVVETLTFFGDDLIPTVVFITPDKSFYIGNAALARFNTMMKSGISDGWLYKDIKRWVGVNKFNFSEYSNKLKSREYNVKLVLDYQVEITGIGISEGPYVSVLDLIALFIKGISAAIFNSYGRRVTSLVCTVPADYNSYKRSFLLQASNLLDEEMIAVVNEPTAAALFSSTKNLDLTKVEHVIVYDFGGGTFDVSYLCLYGKAAVVLDTAGDLFLGGRDIDAAIANFILPQLDGAEVKDILTQCSSIKIDCSSSRKFEDHSVLVKGSIQKVKFTFADFSKIIEPFARRSCEILSKLIHKNGLHEQGVTVIMVGGSSVIPNLQKAVMELKGVKNILFDNKTFRTAVAVGAKVYSDSLVNNKGLVLVDTLSHAILDETVGFYPKVIVGKGQVVPSIAEVTYRFGGGDLEVPVYEGEYPLTFLNEPTYYSKHVVGAGPTVKLRYEIRRDGSLVVFCDGKQLINKFLPLSSTNLTTYVYKDPDAEYRDIGLIDYANSVLRLYNKDKVLSTSDIGNTCRIVDSLIDSNS
nr:heat shock protein 70-like protein [Allamanda chlorotic virus A]